MHDIDHAMAADTMLFLTFNMKQSILKAIKTETYYLGDSDEHYRIYRS